MKCLGMKKLLMVGLLSSVCALGCSHRRCHDCGMMPSTWGSPVVVNSSSSSTTTSTAAEVQSAAHKVGEDEDSGTVAVTVTAAGPHGDVAGIVMMPTHEAERLGMKPGYTPNALVVAPPKSRSVVRNVSTVKEDETYLPSVR